MFPDTRHEKERLTRQRNEDGCSLAVERCTEPERGDVWTDLLEINACLLKLPLQYVAATTYQTKFIGGYVGR